jgi:hypothetical protein
MAYKILSLDGGGSWALIQARVLKDIYGDVSGHEILRQFNLVIANSGGSLVLASLCNNMLISEIISVFEDESKRKQVFSKLSFWEKLKLKNIASLTNVLGPKYSTDRKLSGLKNVLNKYDSLIVQKKATKPILDTYLNELPAIIGKNDLQILVAGYDYFRQRAVFFRSNPASRTDFNNKKFYQVSLADAIHSSSNAPINYFDSPAAITTSLLGGNDKRKTWFWDGAISGFNNPVLAGFIEARTNNPDLPLSDFKILSLGTGTGGEAIIADYENSTDPVIAAIYNKNKGNKLAITDNSSSFFADIKKLSTSILGDPPDSATFITYAMIDPSLSNEACLVRINPCLKPILNPDTQIYEAPDVYKNDPNGGADFIAIMDLDMDAVDNDQVDLIKRLCDKFIVNGLGLCLPNQLIRGDGTGVHLGFDTYKAAKEKWLSSGK